MSMFNKIRKQHTFMVRYSYIYIYMPCLSIVSQRIWARVRVGVCIIHSSYIPILYLYYQEVFNH